MSVKHLTVGSDCPPNVDGLLRCYCMRFCPFSQRICLMLNAKNVKHEIVYINLQAKPEWYVEKNPLQKVPTLEKERGKIMFESLVTCDYIDEAYPDPLLHSNDPWQKGQDRILMELFSKVSSPMYQVWKHHGGGDGNSIEKATAFEELLNGLDFFEAELAKRRTPFYNGGKPGMLDYMIWPWGERLPAVEMMVDKKLDKSRFSKYLNWMSKMKEDPAVKSVYIPPETHKKFLETNFAGNPDYDME